MKTFVMILLALLLPAFAFADMTLHVAVDTIIDVQAQEDYVLEYIQAQIFEFPVETQRQHIITQTTHPEGVYENESYIFTWYDIKPKGALINTEIRTYKKVHNVGTFKLPKTFSPITTEYIKPNHGPIKGKALEIVHTEDSFEAAFRIASWINENISYNLTTLTADVSRPADWVFENKMGVCDELTVLFISMARSVGLESRFVKGIAYTDSPPFKPGWYPHGWAEVYIGEWVPFDITYGQYGYIDDTHVSFTRGMEKPTASYRWKAKNIDVNADTDFFVEVIENESVQSTINVLINPVRTITGSNGYALFEAVIENDEPYYRSVSVNFVSHSALKSNLDYETILLKPNEKKTLQWQLKIPELDKRFIYNYTLSAIHENRKKVFNVIGSSALPAYGLEKGKCVAIKEKHIFDTDYIEFSQYSENITILLNGTLYPNCKIPARVIGTGRKELALTAHCIDGTQDIIQTIYVQKAGWLRRLLRFFL